MEEKLVSVFPKMGTNRFLLRKIEQKDAPQLFHYFSKDEVTKYYDLDTFTNLSQAEELIASWGERFDQKIGIRWGIADKKTNKIIGSVGFHNWVKEHYKAELGFEVTPEYWRQGVMTEVLPFILSYGFNEMGLHRIEAMYDPENTASKATLFKQGFTFEGILRQASFEKGRFCDAAVCSLLKSEWSQAE
ncbi:GNAT family N-acetyltransferase [Peribacillus sp. SCS-37]|uniref:GNAT family N-acetyltransferase n=1 Tax=Paraperibacillus esterisolvens TaxID=3115296 RepID=UPI0039067994